MGVLAQGLLLGVSEYPGRRGVPKDDAPQVVEHQDGVLGGRADGPEPLLARLLLTACLLLLGLIEDETLDADGLPVTGADSPPVFHQVVFSLCGV